MLSAWLHAQHFILQVEKGWGCRILNIRRYLQYERACRLTDKRIALGRALEMLQRVSARPYLGLPKELIRVAHHCSCRHRSTEKKIQVPLDRE